MTCVLCYVFTRGYIYNQHNKTKHNKTHYPYGYRSMKRTLNYAAALIAGGALGAYGYHQYQQNKFRNTLFNSVDPSDDESMAYELEDTSCLGYPISLSVSPNDVQGGKSLKKHMLETGAEVMQSFKPIKRIHNHVCGFHCYSGELDRQVEAHHYCSHLSEDFAQCVIYDSDQADARLIGIEYIVSERLFKKLPEEEKKLWHSHVYEVKSGELVGPRLPEFAEHALMTDLITTYGKTFHTWQIDRGDEIPYGIPQLMMAFTQDNQLSQDLIDKRDKKYGISTTERRKNRADIPVPKIDPLADNWIKTGKAIVLQTGVKSCPIGKEQPKY